MVLICAESGERELILVASMQCGMGGGEEEESLILDFVVAFGFGNKEIKPNHTHLVTSILIQAFTKAFFQLLTPFKRDFLVASAYC